METGSTELFSNTGNKCNDILPDSPIDVARMLIHAEYEYENSELDKRIFNLPDNSTRCKYSVQELLEIAKYLLVFCENNKDDTR
jgi:hypothetical protein